MRFPPFKSDASQAEADAPIRDRYALWPGGRIPYELSSDIRK